MVSQLADTSCWRLQGDDQSILAYNLLTATYVCGEETIAQTYYQKLAQLAALPADSRPRYQNLACSILSSRGGMMHLADQDKFSAKSVLLLPITTWIDTLRWYYHEKLTNKHSVETLYRASSIERIQLLVEGDIIANEVGAVWQKLIEWGWQLRHETQLDNQDHADKIILDNITMQSLQLLFETILQPQQEMMQKFVGNPFESGDSINRWSSEQLSVTAKAEHFYWLTWQEQQGWIEEINHFKAQLETSKLYREHWQILWSTVVNNCIETMTKSSQQPEPCEIHQLSEGVFLLWYDDQEDLNHIMPILQALVSLCLKYIWRECHSVMLAKITEPILIAGKMYECFFQLSQFNFDKNFKITSSSDLMPLYCDKALIPEDLTPEMLIEHYIPLLNDNRSPDHNIGLLLRYIICLSYGHGWSQQDTGHCYREIDGSQKINFLRCLANHLNENFYYKQELCLDIPARESQKLIHYLASFPESSGKRLTVERHRRIWKRSLSQLIISSNDAKNLRRKYKVLKNDPIIKSASVETGEGILNPIIVRQLIDDGWLLSSGYWNTETSQVAKEKGQHLVFACTYYNDKTGLRYKYFFKVAPESPVIEYAASELYNKFTGARTPFSSLFRINVKGRDNHTVVIVSEYIDGINGHLWLKQRDDSWQKKVNSNMLMRLLLGELLINAEDRKPENVMITEDPNLPDNKNLKLIPIDNDRCFTIGMIYGDNDKMELVVKDWLFCLDAMKLEISKEIIDEIQAIDVGVLLENWLENVKARDFQYQKLFPLKLIKAQRAAAIESLQGGSRTLKNLFGFIKQKDVSFVSAFVVQDLISRLYCKMCSIRESLIQTIAGRRTTPLQLLTKVEHALGIHYRRLHEIYGLASERFHFGVKPYYKIDVSNNLLSKSVGTLASMIPTLYGKVQEGVICVPLIDLEADIRFLAQQYEMLINLDERNAIFKDLISSDIRLVRRGIKSLSEIELPSLAIEIINIIFKKKYNDALDEELIIISDQGQSSLLKMLKARISQCVQINLSGCDILTDETLRNLFGKDIHPNISYIQLNGCNKLTAKSIDLISKQCPFLEELDISNTSIDELLVYGIFRNPIYINFNQLKSLKAQNLYINKLLIKAPNLRKLDLSYSAFNRSEISNILEFSRLEKLDLTSWRIDKEVALLIVELIEGLNELNDLRCLADHKENMIQFFTSVEYLKFICKTFANKHGFSNWIQVYAEMCFNINNKSALVMNRIYLDSSDIACLIQFLESYQNLTLLDVSDCSITEQDGQVLLNALQNHSGITRIVYAGNTWSTATMQMVKNLEDRLWASNGGLGSYLNNECVRSSEVLLKDIKISDKGLEIVCDFLKKHQHIKKLDIESCGITNNGCEFLEETIKEHNGLIEILYRWNDWGEAAEIKFRSLANLKWLQHHLMQCEEEHDVNINISLKYIADIGAKYLADWLHTHQYVQSINISHCEIGDSGIESLLSVFKNHQALQKVSYAGNKWSPRYTEILNDCINVCWVRNGGLDEYLEANKHKDAIQVDGTNLSGNNLEILLGWLKSNISVTRLYVNNCKIDDAGGLRLLDVIQQHGNIIDIQCRGNFISTNIIETLRNAVTDNAIRFKLSLINKTDQADLSFHSIKIGDYGAKKLAKLLGEYKNIVTLDISYCGIGEEGGATLLQAIHLNDNIYNIKCRMNNWSNDISTQFKIIIDNKWSENGGLNKYLSTCRHLVDLSNRYISDRGAKILASWLENNLSIIRKLKLNVCSVHGEGNEILLAVLTRFSNILEVNSKGNAYIDKYYEIVGSLNATNYLTKFKTTKYKRHINCSGVKLYDAGAKILASYLALHPFTGVLDLEFCSIGEQGGVALVDALKSNSYMIKINSTGNYWSGTVEDKIAEINNIPLLKDYLYKFERGIFSEYVYDLTSINFANKIIGCRGAKILAGWLEKHPEIISLNIEVCAIGEEGGQLLLPVIKQHPNLINIFCWGNMWSDSLHNEMKRLININWQTKGGLKQYLENCAQRGMAIDLSFRKLCIQGLEILAKWLYLNEGINKLCLSSCDIDDDGAKILLDIICNHQGPLNVDFDNNQLSDAMSHTIANALSKKQLTIYAARESNALPSSVHNVSEHINNRLDHSGQSKNASTEDGEIASAQLLSEMGTFSSENELLKDEDSNIKKTQLHLESLIDPTQTVITSTQSQQDNQIDYTEGLSREDQQANQSRDNDVDINDREYQDVDSESKSNLNIGSRTNA